MINKVFNPHTDYPLALSKYAEQINAHYLEHKKEYEETRQGVFIDTTGIGLALYHKVKNSGIPVSQVIKKDGKWLIIGIDFGKGLSFTPDF